MNNFLLLADWSGQELRVMADYSGEEKLIRAFELGLDVHKLAAYAALGEMPTDETEAKWWRDKGKEINFGTLYGIGDANLAKRMKCRKEEAKEFKAKYFISYPKVAKLIAQVYNTIEKRLITVCKTHGEFCVDWCESEKIRRGWIKNIWGRRRYLTQNESYKGVNYLIQGCLPKSTKVLTPAGWIRIGDLSNTMKSVVWTGEQWATAQKLNRGFAQRIKLTLSDGRSFDCDERHELLTQDGPWPHWMSISNEILGKPLIRDTHQDWGIPIGTVEEWYWLGRMLGDGWICKDGRWGCAFGPTERPALDRLCNWLDTKNIKGKTNSKYGYHIHEFPAQKNRRVVWSITGGTKKGTDMWASLGLTPGTTAKTKRIPDKVFCLDKKRREAVLSGYIDADGYTTNRLQKISSANHLLLEDTLRLMQTLNKTGRISQVKFHNHTWFDLYIHKNQAPLTITQIEYLPHEEMYTLSVKDDKHAFSTEGLISKNTAADLMRSTNWKLYDNLKEYETRIVLPIHDEFIFDMPYTEAREVIPIIVNTMETCDKLKVPLKVDLKWAPVRWSESYSLSCDECNGNGKIFSLTEDERFDTLVKNDWDTLNSLTSEPCTRCNGAGYDLKKIKFLKGVK